MSRISLPYGGGSRTISLPDAAEVVLLEPGNSPGLPDPTQDVFRELSASGHLLNRPAGADPVRVAIAVNDKTRPVPHDVLLPPLLDTLDQAGWNRSEIIFIVAVGAHAPMTEEEFHLVLPSGIADGCRIISHNADIPENLTDLGITSRETPCRINRIFAEADLRIVVGNIEPHQFMGWSGGVKSAVIGLAGRDTIAANHSMMAVDGAGPCLFDDNPVRQDVEEMGRLAGVHLALNVVMNRTKEISAVLAGPPAEVMRRGIDICSGIFTAGFTEPADLVIASPGGHPKDINFYQAQKTLRHGARAAAPTAPVIIVAACTEGVGSRLYERWMAGKKSQRQVKEYFESEAFTLGHHKGMLVAADAIDRDVYLASEMSDEEVENLLLKPAPDVNALIANLVKERRIVRIAVLPYGNTTVPVPAAAG